jgi:hypothetical protein
VREFRLVGFPIGFGGGDDSAAFGGQRLDVETARRRGNEKHLFARRQAGKEFGEFCLLDVRPRKVEPGVATVVVAVAQHDDPNGIFGMQRLTQSHSSPFKFFACRAAGGFDDLGIRLLWLIAEQNLHVAGGEAQSFGETLVQLGHRFGEQLVVSRVPAESANEDRSFRASDRCRVLGSIGFV